MTNYGEDMKYLQNILLSFLCLFTIYCGTDYAEKGKMAFENKDYSEAIKNLTLALKDDSTNHLYDEMICISYLQRGKELFSKTRNLKALNGNLREAQKYLPTSQSNELKSIYAETYVYLAKAYITARASSNDEKEQNFENALNAVKGALSIDSTNVTADSLMISLKESHFQGLIDKGRDLYNKARRTRNPDLYFTSEYYLKEAQTFEAENPQIISLLQKITKQVLPVLNYREGVSLAVSGVTRERKAILMNLSIKNYTAKRINLVLNNFTLVDNQGQIYPVNEHEMRKRELFGEKCLADTVLNSANPLASGIIAFDAPPEIVISYVNYKIDKNKVSRKFFR